ncbi:hypothetical protein BcepSauron_389 [Burkholderia phage BcepSauron]|uniref:Uncharacterized protein n=1 Tax=Burkholderia phage BcepSauron TaxID=2530033 RepID=A0A482MM82_9CAUD|nr:hypothetical protein H1O17_gp389 [Burkholderia phage BcepSauron]QBQ74769.1 hypothetical protein BcepSauron_389 [Burkholderia phage BcepSauron]
MDRIYVLEWHTQPHVLHDIGIPGLGEVGRYHAATALSGWRRAQVERVRQNMKNRVPGFRKFTTYMDIGDWNAYADGWDYVPDNPLRHVESKSHRSIYDFFTSIGWNWTTLEFRA